jgi:hypothetical protein
MRISTTTKSQTPLVTRMRKKSLKRRRRMRPKNRPSRRT